jgi:uncharacterized protein (DUF2062 family)
MNEYISSFIKKIKLKLNDLKRVKPKTGFNFIDKYITDPGLWRMNRRSVSIGVAVGAFCAWIPLPIQMLLATIFSVLFRGNLACGLLLTWITNPITAAPFITMAFTVGNFFDYFASLNPVFKFFIGSIICGAITSCILGSSVYLFWRVIRANNVKV